MDLVALGLYDSALHAFAAALQGVVAAGVSAALPSPAPSGPTGKVATLSLLHLRFSFRLVVDVELPPIWKVIARGRGNMEGLATLNQALMRDLPSCCRIFGGGDHFSASLPLLVFVKNVILMNTSLDPACTGEGMTPWLTCQGLVDASNRGGTDVSLLMQQLDGHLVLADSLCMAVRVRLAVIPSTDESLRKLVTFAFVPSHLFSVGGRHFSAFVKLLRLIERLEELHTEVQGLISSLHLATTLLF